MPATIVSFDVETTGLWAADCHIIEIAAVRWESGVAVDRFASLVHPGRPIDPASIAIHGITDADVADAPGIAEALERFFAFAGGAALAAHNAPFDLSFLAVECARAGRPLPQAIVADTLALARAAFPGLPSYRLAAVAEAVGAAPTEVHRALADAETAGHLYWSAVVKLGEVPAAAWVRVGEVAFGEGDALGAAIGSGAPFEIEYGKFKRRYRIVPSAIFTVQRSGFLQAHCPDLGTEKTFRLDWVVPRI